MFVQFQLLVTITYKDLSDSNAAFMMMIQTKQNHGCKRGKSRRLLAIEEALAVGDEEENVLEAKNVVDVVAHLQLIILSTCSCKLSQRQSSDRT